MPNGKANANIECTCVYVQVLWQKGNVSTWHATYYNQPICPYLYAHLYEDMCVIYLGYTFVCTFVCTYVRTCTWVSICMSICMHICTSVYIWMHICMYIHMCIHALALYICMSIWMHICMPSKHCKQTNERTLCASVAAALSLAPFADSQCGSFQRTVPWRQVETRCCTRMLQTVTSQVTVHGVPTGAPRQPPTPPWAAAPEWRKEGQKERNESNERNERKVSALWVWVEWRRILVSSILLCIGWVGKNQSPPAHTQGFCVSILRVEMRQDAHWICGVWLRSVVWSMQHTDCSSSFAFWL